MWTTHEYYTYPEVLLKISRLQIWILNFDCKTLIDTNISRDYKLKALRKRELWHSLTTIAHSLTIKVLPTYHHSRPLTTKAHPLTTKVMPTYHHSPPTFHRSRTTYQKSPLPKLCPLNVLILSLYNGHKKLLSTNIFQTDIFPLKMNFKKWL